ncbi:MAG: sialidase family protein [Actinomycetota bacterium]
MRTRNSRSLLALAVLVLAAGTVFTAAGLLFVSRDVEVGVNVFPNPPGVIDANNSPTVVANPIRPANLVVVNRVDRPGYTAALHWSANGGASWRTTRLPLPDWAGTCTARHPESPNCPFAPDAAFAPDGTLYVSYVNLQGNGNVPENLWVARSADGGATLSGPVKVAGSNAFQARVVVDEEGTLHVTWLQASDVGLLKLTGPARIVAARSEDGGRSFSAAVPLSDPDRARVGAATPVVVSNGDLAVLYEDFKDDARDFLDLEGPPWQGTFGLVVATSGDGGRSFGKEVELESEIVPQKRFLVFLPETPSIAPGPSGSLYVAWADGRNGDEDVFLRRSLDAGRSWRRAVRVNDNPLRDRTDQFLPRVAVAPGGRVDVVFLDRRRDPTNLMTEATLAVSRDRGGRFENVRLSASPFDSRVGPQTGPTYLGTDLGSRLGLVSFRRTAFAAWADSRRGNETTGRQDIAAARATIPDLSGRWLRILIPAAFLAATLAALAGWWAQRARDVRGEPAPEHAQIDSHT